MARARGSRVLLRIEDHDRQRSRPEFDAALIEDLGWLGFEPDEGPVRQSDADAPYLAALERLGHAGLVYACECTRATFERAAWSGPGCPQRCRERGLAGRSGRTLRVALGGGDEAWVDELVGPCRGSVATAGDPPVRDRHGNWTYGFAVVVDDDRHEVGLVVRGRDLLEATGDQIRLGRALGRDVPPRFAHHPLIRKPGGAKLSKADRDTSVRDLRAAGATREELIGRAAAAVGLIDREMPITTAAIAELFVT